MVPAVIDIVVADHHGVRFKKTRTTNAALKFREAK
jgi:hypothetical protein